MREWQGLCKNEGVTGFMYKCGNGRACVRVREWQGTKSTSTRRCIRGDVQCRRQCTQESSAEPVESSQKRAHLGGALC